MRSLKEIIDLPDQIITITHNTSVGNMFWFFIIQPFFIPVKDFILNIKLSLIPAALFAVFAWFQGLFAPEVIMDLFNAPSGIVEGLYILTGLDFLFGTVRAIFDKRIKFHPKKWIKSFFKVTVYTGSIIVLVIGANMFPVPLDYIMHAVILLLAGYEMWSCMKHLKMTAVIYAAIEVYKNKDDLVKVNWKEVISKIEERSAREFAEKQMFYFGNEDIQIQRKSK